MGEGVESLRHPVWNVGSADSEMCCFQNSSSWDSSVLGKPYLHGPMFKQERERERDETHTLLNHNGLLVCNILFSQARLMERKNTKSPRVLE